MKLTYPAIFYPWDDGFGYTVEVPDLPGCTSGGATLAEARHINFSKVLQDSLTVLYRQETTAS